MRNQFFYIYISKYFLYLKNSRNESSENFQILFIAAACFRFPLKNCVIPNVAAYMSGESRWQHCWWQVATTRLVTKQSRLPRQVVRSQSWHVKLLEEDKLWEGRAQLPITPVCHSPTNAHTSSDAHNLAAECGNFYFLYKYKSHTYTNIKVTHMFTPI